MTTIACTPKVMASDSHASDENGVCNVTKMWRMNGGVLGFSGTFAHGYRFYEWLKDHKKGDAPDIEGSVFLFVDGKTIWCYDGTSTPYPIDDKFAAIGSGGMAAMACMHVGCDPSQAVKIASKVDPMTGGKIKTLEV